MKIITNTNLHSGGGIARRANEMIRYCADLNLPLVVVGIDEKDRPVEQVGSVSIYRIGIAGGKNNSSEVYNGLTNLGDLESKLGPTTAKVKQVIQIEKPDVVMAEGTFYAPWMLHRVAEEMGIPSIVAYAGILTKEQEGAPEPQSTVFRQLEQDFNKKEDFYTFPSDLTKREVEKIFGREIDSSLVIPNGIATEFFGKPHNAKDPKLIGFVGRNHPVKNLGFLVYLAEELNSSEGYSIAAVSDVNYDDPLRKDLEKKGVRIIPPMNTVALKEFLSNAGVIISPSHFETFGNVPMESLAAGTPAIVSRKMGVAEVFDDIGLEHLVLDDFGSPAEVAETVRAVSGSNIGRETHEEIKERFSWGRAIEKYLSCCEDISAA